MMDRIETPHQLLVHLVCIDDKHWPRCKKNGDYSERDAEKEALIAARDALIRADERQKAAERAVKCLDAFENDWVVIDGKVHSKHEATLLAAIMAEPEEATK